ncbi:twin transmembrane helix small protein [Sphingomonas canadensis]|uniref:Twin transmembrane helix small protein n=1 Tax=Sphingomonas canadensis TaxID=1219257 RepID=A0ABW3HAV6_9SPHN|nr:twin transmembrane helix small protein [Sphingomonas canadensis]MCW3837182.1 twin transmembrane helix small protein [Sphingomonas canadensis]
MTLFAILLLVALLIAVLAVLAMGLVNLVKTSDAEQRGEGEGPSDRALKSNKLMWYRIYLQLAAVGVIALLLLFASASGN